MQQSSWNIKCTTALGFEIPDVETLDDVGIHSFAAGKLSL